MIVLYKNTGKATEMLNDLVKIHNDRIAGYLYALNQSSKIESGLYDAFEKIILDSTIYKEQLIRKIKELNNNAIKSSNILGKIYRAWMALKVTFPGTTQKAIIATCLFNEEIALHAYSEVLSSNLPLGKEIFKLIETQENALKEIYATISNYQESHRKIDFSLKYFI